VLIQVCEDLAATVSTSKLPGYRGPCPYYRNPAIAVHVNVTGTLSVLEVARKETSILVCISTATLYGNNPKLPSNGETATPNPVEVFDATK